MSPGYDYFMCLCYARGLRHGDSLQRWHSMSAEDKAIWAKAEEAYRKKRGYGDAS